MRRVEVLIDYVRQLSGNVAYDSNSGVPQSIMALYLSNAQDELQKALVNSKTKFLQKQEIVPVVSGQAEYDYPEDIFMQNIDTLQWSMNSGVDFVNLHKGYTKYRTNTQTGYGYGYYTTDSGYVVTPPIQSGDLYINYMRKLPKLQIRCGAITAVTINGSNQLTALTVSTSGTYSATEIASDNFLCVVDYLGNIKATGIQYSSEASGVFTIVPTTLGTGQTAAIGDFIAVGKYVTNIPELPDICEGYLIKNAYYQAKYGDASSWSDKVMQDMAMTLQTLLDSINSNNDDISQVLITNWDALSLW